MSILSNCQRCILSNLQRGIRPFFGGLMLVAVSLCGSTAAQAEAVVSDDGKTVEIDVDDMILIDHTYVPMGYGFWQVIASSGLQDKVVLNLSVSNTDHVADTYDNSRMDKDYTHLTFMDTKKTYNFSKLSLKVSVVDFRTYKMEGTGVTTNGVTVNFRLQAIDEDLAPRENTGGESEPAHNVVKIFKGTNPDGTPKCVAEILDADSLVFSETPAVEGKSGSATTKDGGIQEWVQLWAGGPKWAKFNIGSSILDYSKGGYNVSYYALANTAAYGGLYTWGGTKAGDNSTYNSEVGANTDLKGDDDTATALWGDNWRMPTFEELSELWSEEHTDWTFYDGYWSHYEGSIIAGYQIKGRGDYADQEIFLPAAGFCAENTVQAFPTYGFYWSSSSTDDVNAHCRYFFNGSRGEYGYFRGGGCSVRAVRK